MPLAFLVALAGSLAVHAAALFLPDVDLSPVPEPAPVVVEIQPTRPPASVAAPRKAPEKAPAHAGKPRPEPHRARGPKAAPATPAAEAVAAVPLREHEPRVEAKHKPDPVPEPAPEPMVVKPVDPRLPIRGYVRFAVYKGDQGLLVGRSEQAWEMAEGHYRLTSFTETVGLAALIKPVRVELESRGQVTAQGLQPEHFATRRNGSETKENANFDWEAQQVTLDRDGSRHELQAGTQDLLSFNYQFGYLEHPATGAAIGVATGKKYETYQFNAVGEEKIETPAGPFRTLHIRAQTDSTTELWLALDHLMVPVKIRYTDRKGESFEQVATELGI